MFFGFLLSFLLAAVPADDLSLIGIVFDGTATAIAEAAVTVENRAEARRWVLTSDAAGTFELERLPLGTYQVRIQKPGYFESTVEVRLESNKILEFTLIAVETTTQEVNVVARPEPINADAVSNVRAVNDEAIQNLPYTGRRNFLGALTLMPGVLNDNSGGMHIHGSRSDQIRYQLDGMNLTDPGTGTLSSNIPIDAIESVDLDLSGYSAEFGKGSGGVVRVNSQFIQDDFRWNLTDFIPGINFKRKTIGEFSPRLLLSGPVIPSRLWFMYSGSLRYVRTFNEDLPDPLNRQNQTVADQLLKLQWNVGEANVLTLNLLHNSEYYGNLGLNPYRPLESTTNLLRRGTTASLSNRVIVGKTILQTMVQWSGRRFSDLAKGTEPLQVRPSGWAGNFFTDRRERTARFHVAQTVAWESLWSDVVHRFKAGIEFDSVRSDLVLDRRSFQLFDEAGMLEAQVDFEGHNAADIRNREYGVFIQDRIVFGAGLQLEVGARADRESIIGRTNIAPRVGFSWLPFGAPRSKISGGAGLFYDAVPLENLQLPRMQRRIMTTYTESGAMSGWLAPMTVGVDPGLKNPHGLHWNLAWEQEWAPRWVSRVNYVEKRGRDQLRMAAMEAPGGFNLNVNNSGKSRYSAVELSLDRPIRTNLRILAAYTYATSKGRPSLSIDFPDPQLELVSTAPLEWDIRHRFLAWGYFPFFVDSQASFSLEARTGFPFTALDNLNRIVGGYNNYRLPAHFVTNFSLEKEVPILFGKRVAIRAGVTNMFNRFNPRYVNAHVDSPGYMQLSDSSGRSFVGRVRLLK